MADSTPQLKRKRETAEAQRKKAKTLLQRKNDAAASASLDDTEAIASTPVAATPKNKPTPKNKTDSQSTPRPAQSTKDAPTSNTPATARKGKKDQKPQTPGAKNKTKKEDALVKTDVPATPGQVVPTSPVKAKKHKSKASAKWLMSSAQGGWFLPSDPVFSLDEKFIILGTLRSLDIYFAETSLLAYKLPVGGSGSLTAYALSATNPTQVYVADSTGLITLWDWVLRTKIGRWDIGATVCNMTVISHSEPAEDLVYSHEQGIINVHALRTAAQSSKTEVKAILKLKSLSPMLGIQVLLNGKFVVAACADSIMVGKRQKITKTAVQDFEYVWRELKFAKRITTFNAYVREMDAKSRGGYDQRDVIDIATGDESGVIFLFEDILATFAAIESSQKGGKSKVDSAENLRPKKFHWHRDAVGSVKWSLDGNYLISGGDETVLTIWQLATGKMQHLPHLTAAIENVVVSPSGSSYAISLANNSVIVISTTELEAKTNIVGVQTRRVDVEQLPNRSSYALSVFHQVPMAVNPKSSREVLFSVPSSQPRQQRSEGLSPEPYLQTYDLVNQHSVSKQALARNNATDPNMGPEGRKIIEPTVKLLQISYDGEWLATVDEWTPPKPDMAYLDEGIPEFNEEERKHRREVYLKFWRREKSGKDDQSEQWKLQTRIDAPHFFQTVSANGRVFDLVADPTGPGFATVGEDHFVRVWRPKTRLRDGMVVRGAETTGMVTWQLDRSIEISDKLDVLDVYVGSQQSLPLRASRLAFSADGSVIAAAISWASEADPGVTHLIDANAAIISRSITEVDVTALSGLAILGRHLIVVGDSITVWDMVLDQLVYCVPINTSGLGPLDRVPLLRFATNESDGTFAVSLPQLEKSEKNKKASSKIIVFSPEQQEPLWSTKSAGITLGLAPRQIERGYVVLDSTSCVRVISPAGSVQSLPVPSAEVDAEMPVITYAQQDDDVEMEEDVIDALGNVNIEDMEFDWTDDDDTVVKTEQLQLSFEESGPSHAMGSLSSVFSSLLRIHRGAEA